MTKIKKLNGWHWLIISSLILLMCIIAFEYGEEFGKVLAS